MRYLWEEAYPKGAEPTEALRLFADDIRYEDFNYPLPFLGKAAVTLHSVKKCLIATT